MKPLTKAQGRLLAKALKRQEWKVEQAKKTLKAAGIVVGSMPIEHRLIFLKVAPGGFMPDDDWMEGLQALMKKQAKNWSKKHKIPYEECQTSIISVAMSDDQWKVTSTPRMFLTDKDLKQLGLKRIKKFGRNTL